MTGWTKLWRLLAVLALLASFLAALPASAGKTAPSDLDPGFGQNGNVSIDFGGVGQLLGLDILPSGKILVTALSTQNTITRLAEAQLTSEGQLDIGFGNGGTISNDFIDMSALWSPQLVRLPDGKIMVFGAPPSNATGGFELLRVNPDGSLDSGFGQNGRVVTPFADAWAIARTVAQQPDGKIIAAGLAGFDFALLRYNSDGSLDNTFGDLGRVRTPITLPDPNPADSIGGSQITKIAVQPDGKIVAVGERDHNYGPARASDLVIARYNPNGTADSTFGEPPADPGQLVQAAFQPSSFLLQPDGKFLVGGRLETGTRISPSFVFTYPAMQRFNADGSVDSGFGSIDPTHRAPHIVTAGPVAFDDLGLQPDGKILAADVGGVGRFNVDGSRDASFGVGGWNSTSFSGYDDFDRFIRVQPDGKIVVAVDPGSATHTQIMVARFNRASSCAPAFSDVAAGDYFYDGVRYLFCQGAVSGYPGNTFQPFEPVIRGQIAKMLVGAKSWNVNHADYGLFADYDATYGPYDDSLAANGVATGYPCPAPSATTCGLANDLYFLPYDSVTRGQLAKMIVLAQRWPVDTTGGPHFSDVPVDNPFYAYVETAYNHHIISGYADGTFRWEFGATRGQASKIIYLALQPLGEKVKK